jgi:threonine dehydrogenase-like Zn-dependent dehydrogenase
MKALCYHGKHDIRCDTVAVWGAGSVGQFRVRGAPPARCRSPAFTAG